MKTKILNSIFSFGAVTVIFGCWQKIEHFPLADLFLTVGLLTECCIFLLYGLQELFGKPEYRGAQSDTVRGDGRVEELLEQQNAILRDVYKTSK